MNRRRLLTGLLGGLFAAPAIVRASSLMAISPVPLIRDTTLIFGQVEIPLGWKAHGSLIFQIRWNDKEIEAFDAKFTDPRDAQRFTWHPERNDHGASIGISG